MRGEGGRLQDLWARLGTAPKEDNITLITVCATSPLLYSSILIMSVLVVCIYQNLVICPEICASIWLIQLRDISPNLGLLGSCT